MKLHETPVGTFLKKGDAYIFMVLPNKAIFVYPEHPLIFSSIKKDVQEEFDISTEEEFLDAVVKVDHQEDIYSLKLMTMITFSGCEALLKCFEKGIKKYNEYRDNL